MCVAAARATANNQFLTTRVYKVYLDLPKPNFQIQFIYALQRRHDAVRRSYRRIYHPSRQFIGEATCIFFPLCLCLSSQSLPLHSTRCSGEEVGGRLRPQHSPRGGLSCHRRKSQTQSQHGRCLMGEGGLSHRCACARARQDLRRARALLEKALRSLLRSANRSAAACSLRPRISLSLCCRCCFFSSACIFPNNVFSTG